MNTIACELERLFDGELVPFDRGGYLEPVAELFPAHCLAILFLADSSGNVSTANHLGSSMDLSLTRSLGAELAQSLQDREFCVLENKGELLPHLAFGVRLDAHETRAIMGGLLTPPVADVPKLLFGMLSALKAAGRLAWLGIQTDLTVKRLQTQLRQLLAEHDTLNAAHRQATVAIIEEHERRLREEQHRQAVAQKCAAVEAANEAKSQFLANMSHEIRTPMTAILGYAEFLQDEMNLHDTNGDWTEWVRTIRRNGEHLLELINDILDLSKIEANRLQIDRTPCSPVKVLSDVVDLMRIRAEGKGLSLSYNTVGEIPKVIQSDELRFRQILINLVGNAIKFTEEGSVRLLASVVQQDDKASMLQIDVVDTGIGIHESEISRLFQPFSQVDASATRRFGGTGLGLSISRRLAQKLGGDISVTSVRGGGSTFRVMVECGESADAASEIISGNSKSQHLPACESPSVDTICGGRSVLLAEDSVDNQRLIRKLLGKAGGKVTVAENGQMACELALAACERGEPFDVILMDMQMPVLDGYEAARWLRKQNYTGPIIALTANAMAEDRTKCLEAGCDDFETKPIDRQRLLSTVARWAPCPSV